MLQGFSHHILSLLIFFPLICSLICGIVPRLDFAKWFSLLSSVATLILSALLWAEFNGEIVNFQFSENYSWIPDFGIHYALGVDGISLLLILLSTVLTPLIIVSQWDLEDKSDRYFFSLLLALESMMIGAVVAVDLVLFYVFWEAMLIPMYFMIGIWGGQNRIYATLKFFLYTMFGSLLMLAAAIALYQLHFAKSGFTSTLLTDMYGLEIPVSIQCWLFIAFALAFAIKVPMWPLHTWLPDAHVQAPTPGSVILAGVMLKMGTYGFLRFAIPLFPEAVKVMAPVMVALGVVGIIYGALVAWMQTDAKKMVAYSSVSHLGFIVIGCFALVSGGSQLSEEALFGAVYQMVNHGVSTGALFFLVGCIYTRRHTRLLADFGGLAANMPWFALILVIATLSSVGLPGTGGFVGEFLVLLGSFQSSAVVGILASLGVVLGAIYMLTLVKSVIFGPLELDENKELKDLNSREFIYLAPLALLAILMGLFPNQFMEKTRSSVEHLAKNFAHYRIELSETQLSSTLESPVIKNRGQKF